MSTNIFDLALPRSPTGTVAVMRSLPTVTVTLRLLASHSTDMAEVSLSKGINYLKHEDDIFSPVSLPLSATGK